MTSFLDKVYDVLHEMLTDRGYIHIESETESSIIARNNENLRVLVYLVHSAKVSVKKIKMIKDMIQEDEHGFHSLILVYKSSITSFAKQFITTDVNNILVQVFSEKEMSFNVTKHTLVPKHELLSTTEKLEVMARFKTKLKNFPNILSTDPVSKYYGYIPGSLIRITRKSPTAGTYVSYRAVT